MNSSTGQIGTGITEAETLTLSGTYGVESLTPSSGGKGIRTDWNSGGTAGGTFTGAAGSYTLSVTYLNENDGEASWSLRVNGQTVDSWTGAGGTIAWESRTVPLTLNPADLIEIVGMTDRGAYARVDFVEITAAGDGAPPPSLRETSSVDYFAFLGQSNAAGHFFKRSGDDSGGALGNDVFETKLQLLLGSGPVTAINGAVSGSGSNQRTNSTEYWWDIAADKPGPNLLRAVQEIKGRVPDGKDLDGIIWAQGEADARAILSDGANQRQVLEDFVHSTRKVFEYLKQEFGDVPILIQELGDFAEDGGWLDGPIGALTLMRGAQAKLADEMGFVRIGARTSDVTRHDTIHFDNEGYGVIAERLAETAASHFDAGQAEVAASYWF